MIRKWWILAAVLVTVATEASAQSRAKPTGAITFSPSTVKAGEPTTREWWGEGGTVFIDGLPVSPAGKDVLRPKEDLTSYLQVTGRGFFGRWRQFQTSAEVKVVQDPTPEPEPKPDPKPEPPGPQPKLPVPVPLAESPPTPTVLHGVIVEESSQRTATQAVVLLSPKTKAMFKGGVLRIVDGWEDDGSRRDLGDVLKPYADIAVKANIKPYLIVVAPDGGTWFAGALPAKVTDLEALITKIRKGEKP